jgi:hypothetical protein
MVDISVVGVGNDCLGERPFRVVFWVALDQGLAKEGKDGGTFQDLERGFHVDDNSRLET